MSRRGSFVAVLVVMALIPLVGHGEEKRAGGVEDSSYLAPDGTRVLRQSIVLEAGPEEAWKVFTTEAGWKRLGVAFAKVDFRVGGIIETSYTPGAKAGDPANIHNRVLAYLPLRMVAIQAVKAPPGFPEPDLLPHLFSVFEIEELEAGRVRLTVNGVGYRDEPAYKRLEQFFKAGNGYTLARLRQQLERAR